MPDKPTAYTIEEEPGNDRALPAPKEWRPERENLPAEIVPDNPVERVVSHAYEQTSNLSLTEEEAARLREPFPDDAIEILPTGEIYVPHIFIRERLTQVLGPGQWAMVCIEQRREHRSAEEGRKAFDVIHCHWML